MADDKKLGIGTLIWFMLVAVAIALIAVGIWAVIANR